MASGTGIKISSAAALLVALAAAAPYQGWDARDAANVARPQLAPWAFNGVAHMPARGMALFAGYSSDSAEYSSEPSGDGYSSHEVEPSSEMSPPPGHTYSSHEVEPSSEVPPPPAHTYEATEPSETPSYVAVEPTTVTNYETITQPAPPAVTVTSIITVTCTVTKTVTETVAPTSESHPAPYSSAAPKPSVEPTATTAPVYSASQPAYKAPYAHPPALINVKAGDSTLDNNPWVWPYRRQRAQADSHDKPHGYMQDLGFNLKQRNAE
ncbi:hypothetical protein H4R19_000179 [Coemansia spiralis]|nr:hypothetical protein H4R19_000179 [Coemansia spiralis]